MSAKMKPVYIITRWRDWFTCSQSARVIQNPTWTPIPIAKDDRARRRLLLLPGGAEAYAALMLIVSVAAKMPERGVLIDDSGIVLDAFDVASLTGADAGLFERAIPLLMRPDIGYLDRRSRSASTDRKFDSKRPGVRGFGGEGFPPARARWGL